MSDEYEIGVSITIEEARAEIADGIKALKELHDDRKVEWPRWSRVIRGLRGLCVVCFAKAGTSDMKSQAYRDAMSSELGLKKNAAYAEIADGTRSYMYQLMYSIDDIDAWWESELSEDEQHRWKHPQTIAKHCPPELLGKRSKSSRKKKAKKKKGATAEEERLWRLVEKAVKALRSYNPQLAEEIHDELVSGGDLDDSIEDIYAPATH